MESTKSGYRKTAGHKANLGIPAEPREGRLDRTDPRTRHVNRSSRADRYSRFANELLRDLDPRGTLERLMADHVVQSAWKLKLNLETQGARDRLEKSDPNAEAPKKRIRSTELDRASRSMREAIESLDYMQARPRRTPIASSIGRENFDEAPSNEWPVLPGDPLDDVPAIPDAPVGDDSNWQDRLVFDFDISDVSPVVKGTWVTVAHVVSLIVDGWTWSDILRSHPELTEDDIRTCVAYAMAEENTVA